MNKRVYSQDLIGRKKALPSIWRVYWYTMQKRLDHAILTNQPKTSLV